MSLLQSLPVWLRALVHPPQHAEALFPEPDQEALRQRQRVLQELANAREARHAALLRFRHFD